MSHRTQIILTDDHYALLKRESRRRGIGMAELIRRAIARTYGNGRGEGDWIEESFGAWSDRGVDSVEYVKRLRGPGLGYKLLGDDPARHEHPD